MSARDVVITGVGIVSSLGVGREAHERALTCAKIPDPIVDSEAFAPYSIHPLPEIDWSQQIPRRGDQRQMDDWQRLGVFTAGLALDDAGLKDDTAACATMDMIVAAGGGERDIAVDTLIVDEAANHNDRERMLNEKLTRELRPTLFLAQLSNLLAGNISIVHKVTGSSRTFMGEEAAGISAFETAFARIRAGQSTHALVGGASIAGRAEMLFVYEAVQALSQGDWRRLWSRGEQMGGGIVPGSAAAFLVLESRDHATGRNAAIHATLNHVAGDRGKRENGGLEERLAGLVPEALEDDAVVFSGASGLIDISAREKGFLQSRFPNAALRGYSGLFGHAIEAQFPVGVALAALALRNGHIVAPFDDTHETPMARPAGQALVTTVGYTRAEGSALLSRSSGVAT